MIAQGQEAQEIFVEAVNQMYGSQVQPARAGSQRSFSVMYKSSEAIAPQNIPLRDPHQNAATLQEAIAKLRANTNPGASLIFSVVRHVRKADGVHMESMAVALDRDQNGELVLSINGIAGPKPTPQVFDLSQAKLDNVTYAGVADQRRAMVVRSIRGFINNREFDEAFPTQSYPRIDMKVDGSRPQ